MSDYLKPADLDHRHADPRIGVRRPGDAVELGTAVGVAMEPQYLRARVVGIRPGKDRRQKFILRGYLPGDGWYPTGECYSVPSILLVPWVPPKSLNSHPGDTRKGDA